MFILYLFNSILNIAKYVNIQRTPIYVDINNTFLIQQHAHARSRSANMFNVLTKTEELHLYTSIHIGSSSLDIVLHVGGSKRGNINISHVDVHSSLFGSGFLFS